MNHTTLSVVATFCWSVGVALADEAACERGWALVDRGNEVATAIREYDACLKGRPAGEGRAGALLVRGSLLAHQKLWKEARADFEEAIAQRETPDFYDFTYLVHACVNLRDFNCARKTLLAAKKYVENAPERRRDGLNQSIASMEAKLKAAEQ